MPAISPPPRHLTLSHFRLRGTENVYTQHQPLITKEILPDIIKGRRRPDLKYLDDDAFGIINGPANGSDSNYIPKKTVIFVIGGITYEETRAVYMANKELPNSNTIIGGTSLLNFDTFMDEAGVVDKFGVRPDQIIDYLALVGDSVDNIPGVQKCGPKTAVKWLSNYGSMEGVRMHMCM